MLLHDLNLTDEHELPPIALMIQNEAIIWLGVILNHQQARGQYTIEQGSSIDFMV